MIQFTYVGQQFAFTDVDSDVHISSIMKDRNTFYEADVLEQLRDRLGLQAHEGVAIDVGAYVGTHSVYFARVCGFPKVIAFEPDPNSFEVLQRNLHLNGIDNRTVCVNKAVGRKRGICKLVRPYQPNGGSSRVSYTSANGIAEIQVTRLDDELGKQGEKRVRLLKIDVEGFELEVVRGARQMIDQHRPLLSVEIHSAGHLIELLWILRNQKYLIVDCLGASPTYILEASPAKPFAQRLASNALWVLRSLIPESLSALRWYCYRTAKAVI
jgi:FkbM family methyltransferase